MNPPNPPNPTTPGPIARARDSGTRECPTHGGYPDMATAPGDHFEVGERGARDPLHFTLPAEPAIVSYCPLCRAEFDTSDPAATVIPYRFTDADPSWHRRHDDLDTRKAVAVVAAFLLGVSVGLLLIPVATRLFS